MATTSPVLGPDGLPYHLGADLELDRQARARWLAEGSPPRLTATGLFGSNPDPAPPAFTLADLVYWWYDQGPLGSCFCNATTQVVQIALAYAARRLNLPVGDTTQLSRRWGWYQGRKLDGMLGSRADGGSGTNVLRAFHESGIVPEASWPYKADHAWCEATPPPAVVALSQGFSLAGLLALDFGQPDAIEQAIWGGTPPSIGTWWPFGWDQGEIDQYGRTAGIGAGTFAHELAVIGYVRPGVWDKYRWYHLLNSHGPIYPLPTAAMRAAVPGYASARADRCYCFWAREDYLVRIAAYGSNEMIAPVGPVAPDPRPAATWQAAAA